MRRHRDLPPRHLLTSLVDQVRQFSPREQREDITVLVAKCKINGESFVSSWRRQ